MASSSQENDKAAHEHEHERDPDPDPDSDRPQNYGDHVPNVVNPADGSHPLPHRLHASVNEGSANRILPFDPIRDIEPDMESDQRPAHGRQSFSSPPRNTPGITSTLPSYPASEYGRMGPVGMGNQPRTPFGHGQQHYTPASIRPSTSNGFTPPIQRPAHSSPGVYQYHRDNSETHGSDPGSSPWLHTRPGSSPTPGSGSARRESRHSRPQSTVTARRTIPVTRRSETPRAVPSTPPQYPRPRRSRSRSPIRDPARVFRDRTDEQLNDWRRKWAQDVEKGYKPELGRRYGRKFSSCKRCSRLHLGCEAPEGQNKCGNCLKADADCVPNEEGEADKKPDVKSRRPRREDREDDNDGLGGAGHHYNLAGGGGTGPIVID